MSVGGSNRILGTANPVDVVVNDGSGNPVTSFGGSGGTSSGDDSPFSIGSASSVVPMAGLFDDVAPDSVDEGDVGVVRMTGDRKLLMRIVGTNDANRAQVDASGQQLISDLDGTYQATLTAANTQSVKDYLSFVVKYEDGPSGDLDNLLGIAFVRQDTPANTSGTDGDYEHPKMSAGRVWVSAKVDTALPAGTNAIGKLSSNSGVTIGAVELAAAQTLATVTTVSSITSVGAIQPGTAAANLGKGEDDPHVSGHVGVMALAVRTDTLAASSGTDGDYEVIHTTPTGAIWTTPTPSTTGGWSTFNATTGDGSTGLTNAAQAIKASAGTLGGWYIYNPNAAVAYVAIYNVASGSVTVGTTNPQMVLGIPAGSAANIEFGNGINFSTAISVAAATTTGGNSANASAVEANFYYK